MGWDTPYRPILTRAELERRRLAAADDLRAGMSQADVARKYGVDRGSVSRWNKALRAGGKRALRSTKARGRTPVLSKAQSDRLVVMLEEGAEMHGFSTDLWTGPRVQRLIWQEFGLRLHESNVYRLLARLGFTWQKPARRARERDERAIRRWVRKEWPQIAKKGRGPAP